MTLSALTLTPATTKSILSLWALESLSPPPPPPPTHLRPLQWSSWGPVEKLPHNPLFYTSRLEPFFQIVLQTGTGLQRLYAALHLQGFMLFLHLQGFRLFLHLQRFMLFLHLQGFRLFLHLQGFRLFLHLQGFMLFYIFNALGCFYIFKALGCFYIFKALGCFTSSRLYAVLHLQGFRLFLHLQGFMLFLHHQTWNRWRLYTVFKSVALNCASRFRQQTGRHLQSKYGHIIAFFLFSNSSNHK